MPVVSVGHGGAALPFSDGGGDSAVATASFGAAADGAAADGAAADGAAADGAGSTV
jgi:hypothetical protein